MLPAPPSADADEPPPAIVVDPLNALAMPAEISIVPAVPVLPLDIDNDPDDPAVESPVYRCTAPEPVVPVPDDI